MTPSASSSKMVPIALINSEAPQPMRLEKKNKAQLLVERVSERLNNAGS